MPRPDLANEVRGLGYCPKAAGSITSQARAILDLRACKTHAMQTFPPDNPYRMAIRQEPDFLPRETGLAKLETYL